MPVDTSKFYSFHCYNSLLEKFLKDRGPWEVAWLCCEVSGLKRLSIGSCTSSLQPPALVSVSDWSVCLLTAESTRVWILFSTILWCVSSKRNKETSKVDKWRDYWGCSLNGETPSAALFIGKDIRKWADFSADMKRSRQSISWINL